MPKTYKLCLDESVIGTIFYVMEMVEGNIYWEPTIPEVDNELRAKIYIEKNKTLSDLHNTNYKDIGLEDFGKQEIIFLVKYQDGLSSILLQKQKK